VKKFILFLYFIALSNFTLADSKMELGLEVYKEKAQCGTCHIMQAAGSEGNIGPNLDQLNAQMDQIIYVVTNGIGVMPPWGGILTKQEIEAVSYYVFKSTNK
tara:strand:+ start:1050 stop:1355 length:306 start_codon:yes stop_codon:yes gene_type:complete